MSDLRLPRKWVCYLVSVTICMPSLSATLVQFLALLDEKLKSGFNGSKSGGEVPSLRALSKYEAGLARLPLRVRATIP